MKVTVSSVDLVIIIVYLVGIVVLGCWAGLRQRRKVADGKSYFLAGRSLTWPFIGLALFSANIQTTHLVSLAQEGYLSGIVYGNLEWMASFLLIVLALFFAPFYLRARVATLPDFLEKRYSPQCRDFLAVIGMMTAIFFHIGMALYAGGVLFRNLFGLDIMISISVIAVLTVLYTAIGGLMAVVVTESFQTLIMLLGSATLFFFGLHEVGGWSEMVGNLDPEMMSMWRSSDDPSGMPWYAVVLGYPVLGLWYWCADQTIVQRVLGAKDENHARVGPLFCGFLKILPVFFFTFPGMILLAMVNKGQVAPLANSEDAYGFLIQNLLPVGLKGVLAAALLAALMSTISGALNSAAVLFSYDVYKRFSPGASDRSLVKTGRWVTVFAMILGILWTPVIGTFPSIMRYVLAVVSHISPPITTVFIWGVLWRGASATGAKITLWLGSALGLAGFLLTVFKEETGWQISPLMDCFYLFLVCSAILVVVSLWRPSPETEESRALVWDHPMDVLRDKGWSGLGNYKFLSGLLFFVMVALYIFFR